MSDTVIKGVRPLFTGSFLWGKRMRRVILVICGVIVLGLWTIYAFAQTEEPKAASSEEQKVPGAEPQMPGQPAQMPEQPPAGGPMPEQSLVPTQMEPQSQPTPSSTSPTRPISAEEATEGVKVSKERISLDLKGIDITELLRILSLKMGLTIVPSKGVSGRVNIFLNNLTFDAALDVILISQDLTCERKGDIINIMTSAEYERLYGKKYNEKRKFKSIKLVYAKPSAVFNALSQIKSDVGKIIVDEATGTILLIDIPEKLELMETTVKDLDRATQTEIFDLKYAKPADVKAHLSTAITTGPGELFVDERSSKVVVSDLPEKMKKIKRLVKTFDEETRQVFIEAEIVQITLNKQFQRGVDWEKIFGQNWLKDLDFVGKFPVSPALSVYQKISIGSLARDKYTAVLNLLQTFGDTKILSRPRISVVNNQEAKILVGAREAYVTQTLSQAEATTVTSESIEFIDVGVKLNVVPTINIDGFVTIKIRPEVSSVRETITTALGSRIPIVETSESETVVKVKDGVMIMIAGLMKEEKRDEISGTPVLSKIPLIGTLFGTRSKQTRKTELIVFLTPHIISGDVRVAGTEPEKLIPPDIVPKDIEESIISKKIEEIKVKPKEIPKKEYRFKEMPSVREKPVTDIQEKMKGIKEY